MKKIIQLVAGVSALLVLAACGGGSEGASVKEYSLADYEGRVVSTDSLAGTWVAVGTGTKKYSGEDGADSEKIAVKEYFVIKGASSNYTKTECENYTVPNNVTVAGDQITFGDFSGTITGNSLITGSVTELHEWQDGYSEQTNIALSAVKISDDTSAFGVISASTTAGAISTDLFCFQQYNGVATWGDSSLIIEAYPMALTRWTGAYGYTSLNSASPSAYIDSDFEGESVTFNLISNSSLSETVTFSASDNSVSLTGTIQVQLPEQ